MSAVKLDIENSVSMGIEKAAEYVSALSRGTQGWSSREYQIAETAARAAVSHFQQLVNDAEAVKPTMIDVWDELPKAVVRD